MLHAMIMAGGGGTRFWPRSRQKRPKQFLKLTGDRTLLQMAFDRVDGIVAPDCFWVVTGSAYRDETGKQLPALPAGQIVGEPCGKDTAPCIALAAALIARRDPDAIMLVMPADHVIEPVQEFRRAVHGAQQMAEEYPDALLTFGIPPTFPATGYGYIHRGPVAAQRQGLSVCRVRAFREKPDHDTAERFVASGEYFWNAGIFVWKVAAILKELNRQRPALAVAARSIADLWDSPERETVLEREYPLLERVSIDFAIMEHAAHVLVLQAPFQWDDVGSWLALERLHPQDADGNTILARHRGVKTRACIIAGEPDHLIATAGVENLVIIKDGNATLIADRRAEGEIKQLVELLKSQNLKDFT